MVFSQGSSKASPRDGYYIYPNGLIMQWGKSSDIKLSFPINFPNECLSFTATREYPTDALKYSESWRNSKSAGIVNIKSYNTRGAVMTGGTSDEDGGSFFGFPGSYFWVAIGW